MKKVLNIVFGLMLMSTTAAQGASTSQANVLKQRAMVFVSDHKKELAIYAAGVATPTLLRFASQKVADTIGGYAAQVAKDTGKKVLQLSAGAALVAAAAVGVAALVTNKPPREAVVACKGTCLAWLKNAIPGLIPTSW